nr:MAG TPA: hypothetical protein [Bacteriophage sp.]
MVTIVSIVIQPMTAQGYNGCSEYGRYSRYLGHIIQIHYTPYFWIL